MMIRVQEAKYSLYWRLLKVAYLLTGLVRVIELGRGF